MDAFAKACPLQLCISLDTAGDRQAHFKKEFQRNGWPKTPEFCIVKRDHENPGRGCYTSHLTCMKKGLEAKVPWLLVFEDDITFEKKTKPEVWKEVTQFMKTNKEWDIILLGHCTGDYRKETETCPLLKNVPNYKYISKAKCLCTHAILYSKKFMQRMVTDYPEYVGYEIDDFYAVGMQNLNMYVVQQVFGQSDKFESTIDDDSVERQYLTPSEQKKAATEEEGFESSGEEDRTLQWFHWNCAIVMLLALIMVILRVH